ncbi:unnamed protein product [Tilletia controversa]|nr:unnamed protein product [Tilletia controversa]
MGWQRAPQQLSRHNNGRLSYAIRSSGQRNSDSHRNVSRLRGGHHSVRNRRALDARNEVAQSRRRTPRPWPQHRIDILDYLVISKAARCGTRSPVRVETRVRLGRRPLIINKSTTGRGIVGNGQRRNNVR